MFLFDQFGLWLGFHNCDQPTYLEMIEAHIEFYRIRIGEDSWRAEAIEWAATRGSRLGRVTWRFTQDLVGRLRTPLT